MKRHIYVVVIVSSDHNAKTAVIAGDKDLKGMSLSKVLEHGWVPVRETPMGGSGGDFCSLVLLELADENAAVAERPAAAAAPVAAPKPKAEPVTPVPTPVATQKKAAVPVPAAPVKVAEKKPAAKAPEPDSSEGLELVEDEAPKKAAPKKASDSDVSFDFLESLDD